MEGFENKNVIAPKIQVLTLAIFAVVGMLGARLMAKNLLTIWQVAATCLLLFAIINNCLSFFAQKYKTYLLQSIYSFLFLLIGLIVFATLLSGISVFDAGTYRTIFLIVLIANFIFISMVMTVKGFLIAFAEKDKKLK